MASRYHYVCHDRECMTFGGLVNDFEVAIETARYHKECTGHKTGVGLVE